MTGTATVVWSPERSVAVPAAERIIDVAIQRVVALPQASPLRWRIGQHSTFNPPSVHAA